MDKKTLKNIMHFLEKEDNKSSVKWKLENNIPFSKEELNVKGNLLLQYTKITSLPEGLKVGGNLDLDGCYIFKSLPKGLEIGGYLSLTHSDIKSLPKGLEVGKDLFIGNTLLAKLSDDELREMIKPGYIKGEIRR